MGILRIQSIMVGSLLVSMCAVATSQTTDSPFERFEERLKREVPTLEQLPTTDMLEDDADQQVHEKTRQEAQELCDAYASTAGLRLCEARKTTVHTAKGRVDEWHCVCR